MIRVISLVSLLTLANCALVPAAVVGAAFSPVVQPVVDRALILTHLDFVDPAGTSAVKEYDQGKAAKADDPSAN
jgi:hypothetical protein